MGCKLGGGGVDEAATGLQLTGTCDVARHVVSDVQDSLLARLWQVLSVGFLVEMIRCDQTPGDRSGAVMRVPGTNDAAAPATVVWPSCWGAACCVASV